MFEGHTLECQINFVRYSQSFCYAKSKRYSFLKLMPQMQGVREFLIGSHAQPQRGASMCQNYKSKEYKIQNT